jgi:hypothetical protein
MIEGGCFCGAIRYAIDDGDYWSIDCHCTMCRRLHAAPYVTWLVVPTGKFRYTSSARPVPYESSASGTRHRCAVCGTQVTCVNAQHPEIVDVAVGSLDAPERHPATREVFTDTRMPAFAGVRPENQERR